MNEKGDCMERHPLEDLSELILSLQTLSKTTLKNYRLCYKKYIRYLTDNEILYAKTSDVIRFRDGLRELGYSTYYIYIHISSLKSLYRHLRIHQVRLHLSTEYAYDIMINIKNEKIKRHLKKPMLTLGEARHLLLHTKMNRKTIYDYRNYAIVCLMLTAGLSPYEIIHLKKENYQILGDQALLHIRKRNSMKIDTIQLSNGIKEAIDDYLIRRKKVNPYLFISQNHTTKEGHLSRTFFYYVFDKIIKKCGLEYTGITPQSLRHTAAYLNLLRGGTIESTKKLLRHVDLSSTLVYKHHIEQMNDDTEAAIEAFILKEDSAHMLE